MTMSSTLASNACRVQFAAPVRTTLPSITRFFMCMRAFLTGGVITRTSIPVRANRSSTGRCAAVFMVASVRTRTAIFLRIEASHSSDSKTSWLIRNTATSIRLLALRIAPTT